MRIELPKNLLQTPVRLELNRLPPPPPPTDEDIDAFTYVTTHDPTSNQTSVNGLNFSPDGFTMFVPDFGRTDQYTLGVKWDPASAGSQVSMPNLPGSRSWVFVTFNAAGTRAYYYNPGSTDFLRTQTLSEPYDLTTANNDEATEGFGDRPLNGSSMLLLDNEQDFYLLDSSGGSRNKVYHHIMSVAGDITTSALGPSGTSGALDFAAEADTQQANTMDFSPNGTKLYIGHNSIDTIFQYDMSVAYDISTAVYSGKSLVLQGLGSPEVALSFFHGMHIRKDTGKSMFIQHGDNSNFFVDEYTTI